MNPELRQVSVGFDSVMSYGAYDVNGYRFHTHRHEQNRPNRRTTNTGVCTKGSDGNEYYGRIEEIYEVTFPGRKKLKPVLFKCHWFDPNVKRENLAIGLVEIRQSSVYAGDDVYIVAQQATQVYYLSYPCKNDDLLGWDVVYKVSPHGRLPIPNNEDYNIDPNTYDGEFFQENGLTGNFVIDLTDAIDIEVEDDESGDDSGDDVRNERDVQLLEKIQLGIDEDMREDEEPDALEMRDSDDDTYHPDNPDTDVYF